ncbi:MAG: prepilin-type N-terminal cleavage/methylation domain-containing protein [Pseudomonadota bacterium]
MNRTHGFTLIEVIGVLAVLALIAAALAPNVVQMVDEGFYYGEQKSLDTLANGLEQHIGATKSIPTTSNWHTAIADYAALPVGKITHNDKRYARRIYFDPRFFSTSDQNFSGYTQTDGLATAPNSPRIMIVSSMRGDVNTNLTSFGAFDAVWQQTSGAALTEGRDLLIQRINLASMFVKVSVEDGSGSSSSGSSSSGSSSSGWYSSRSGYGSRNCGGYYSSYRSCGSSRWYWGDDDDDDDDDDDSGSESSGTATTEVYLLIDKRIDTASLEYSNLVSPE